MIFYFTIAYDNPCGDTVVVHGHTTKGLSFIVSLIENKDYEHLESVSIVTRKFIVKRNGRAYRVFDSYISRLYGGVFAYA